MQTTFCNKWFDCILTVHLDRARFYLVATLLLQLSGVTLTFGVTGSGDTGDPVQYAGGTTACWPTDGLSPVSSGVEAAQSEAGEAASSRTAAQAASAPSVPSEADWLVSVQAYTAPGDGARYITTSGGCEGPGCEVTQALRYGLRYTGDPGKCVASSTAGTGACDADSLAGDARGEAAAEAGISEHAAGSELLEQQLQQQKVWSSHNHRQQQQQLHQQRPERQGDNQGPCALQNWEEGGEAMPVEAPLAVHKQAVALLQVGLSLSPPYC